MPKPAHVYGYRQSHNFCESLFSRSVSEYWQVPGSELPVWIRYVRNRNFLIIYWLVYLCPKSIRHVSPRSFPVDGEIANFLRINLLATRPRKKLATSRCNGIWEATRHNRNNGLLPALTCCGLVTDLLRGSYGGTGVIDFGLYWISTGLALLSCITGNCLVFSKAADPKRNGGAWNSVAQSKILLEFLGVFSLKEKLWKVQKYF